MGTVVFELKLPFKVKKEKGFYISCCPVLDIHSQGDTLSEAKKKGIHIITARISFDGEMLYFEGTIPLADF